MAFRECRKVLVCWLIRPIHCAKKEWVARLHDGGAKEMIIAAIVSEDMSAYGPSACRLSPDSDFRRVT